MSQLERVLRHARLASGLLGYLRRPLDESAATSAIRVRLEQRDERFLACARTLIYAHEKSPLRALLLWAGCAYADLERAVRTQGLEDALAELRDAGVRLSLDEVKGRAPIRRSGLEIAVSDASFDNPVLGGALVGHTSGSRAPASRVLYGWEFFAEEAANELLLYAAHGASRLPGAFWLPGPPSISGIHNLFIELGFGRAPERWYSHLPASPAARAAIAVVRAAARPRGVRVPRVEALGSDDAAHVARWMAAAIATRGGCVLKAFASSALRVAAAARDLGIDLRGSIVLAGGEPLTVRRSRFIAATGARVHPRYVTTETGLVAASCGHGAAGDDAMHVYGDRLAVIPGDATGGADDPSNTLLFTTLSPAIGKVLLNADLGDSGRLDRRACGCAFGRLGMDLHASAVRAREKLTLEGMSVDCAVLDDAIGAVVEELGAGPHAYQLLEEHDAAGLGTITVKLSHGLGAADVAIVGERILQELERRGAGAAIAARFWRNAGTLRVVRGEPEASAGAKLPTLVRRPAAP